MKRVVNGICVILGFVCFGLGAVGAVMPVIPTMPFLLAAAFFFARGSERFHKWFVSTNLYKRYIEQAVKKKAMDKTAKRNMLITLGIVFTLGIIFSPMFAKGIIFLVATFHFYYFLFRIKTVPEGQEMAGATDQEETERRIQMPENAADRKRNLRGEAALHRKEARTGEGGCGLHDNDLLSWDA